MENTPADLPDLTATVQTLASHALSLYLAGLMLLLLGISAGWLLFRRYGLHREQSRLPPLAYLLGHLALGFAVIAGAATLFAGIAEAIGDGEEFGRLDLLFSDTLRTSLPRAALQGFAQLTHFGDPLILTLFTATAAIELVRLGRRWLCAGLLAAVLGNALLNLTLKAIFQRTRPLHEHGLATAEGWSFPSGHSSGALVVYGMLAYLLVRLLPARVPEVVRLAIALLAAAIVFTTGCSRIFLQVHFASDVLAGFASGLAWLLVCILTIEAARFRYDSPR